MLSVVSTPFVPRPSTNNPKNIKGNAAGTTKINYIAQLHQYHNNKGSNGIADNTIQADTGTGMVFREAEDLERITD